MSRPRVTRAHAEAAFVRLAERYGATVAEQAWAIDDPRREGAWFLDHNGAYGGYEVRAYCASSPPARGQLGEYQPQCYTAEDVVFSGGRRSARDFVGFVGIVMDALRVMEYGRGSA